MPFDLSDLSTLQRILLIALVAAATLVLVRVVRRFSEWLVTPRDGGAAALAMRPKVVTVTKLASSAVTFAIYFSALGLVLRELGVPLTGYLASASVIGLAIGFGSQGLVQDVVTGLTLILSDVLDVGDVVDIAGQTGRVERIGLRFTVLVNVLDQRVYMPNRNIAQINRYRRGYVRVYADVQVPDGMTDADVIEAVGTIGKGMFAQHGRLLLREPQLMGVRAAEPGGWRYLRVKFRIWPGQLPLIETVFRQRVLAALRAVQPGYADWMIGITFRGD